MGSRFQGLLSWLQLSDWEKEGTAGLSSAMLRLHSVERELLSRCVENKSVE